MEPFNILVMTTWAPPRIGGPQSFYNLFCQFPRDSYTILTSSQVTEHESGQGGSRLAGKYVFYDRENSSPPPSVRPRTSMERMEKMLKKIPWIGSYVADILSLSSAVAGFTVSALRIVRSSRPDLLLGVSDTGPALTATYIVSKLTKLPYAVYLFDLYRGNRFGPFHRLLARFVEPRLLKDAALVILTNEETDRHLRNRYRAAYRSQVIHNSAFPEDFERFRTPYDPAPPFTVLFTGNIYWAQEKAVLNIVHAMDSLRDLPVRLDLYIPVAPRTIQQAVAVRPNVRLTSAPQSEIPRIQCGATLLFLPFSWGTTAPDIIATASPGKYTDYLASGRPMLVHAPDDSYISRCAKKNGTGIVVSQDSVSALAGAIRQFLQKPEAGRRYVENSMEVFDRYHDARKNAKKLWAALNEAAGRGKTGRNGELPRPPHTGNPPDRGSNIA